MRTVEMFDHPLPFVIAMFLVIFGIRAFVKWGASQMGWQGVVAFVS